MGLADWFSTFWTNLQVQDGGTISTRCKAITRRLNTDFWTTTSDTAHSLYVGSYGRNTAIRGFSDLDMLFSTNAMPEMGNPLFSRLLRNRLRKLTRKQVSELMDK
jgi:tRNA nucleotidyltransferase (CCA-adding enzyme)